MQLDKKERNLSKSISDRAFFLSRDAMRLTEPGYVQTLSREQFTGEAEAIVIQTAELLGLAMELKKEN